MSCLSVNLRTASVIFIVLLFSNYVVTQFSANSGVGIPLPILKGSQAQGQSAVVPNYNPILAPPFSVKADDDFIVSPNLGIGLEGSSISTDNQRNVVARGFGSLQHIPEPRQDSNVQSLLRHPDVLKKIQKETSSDSAVRVSEIITAHTQVVGGQITYLDLKIVETKCPIGAQNLAACEVDISEDPYICEIAVWRRPWLNSTKVVDEQSKCAETESDTDFKNWNKGNDILRSDTDDIGVPLRGLPHYLDGNQVALEAFDYINRGSESKFKGQMMDYQIGDVKHDAGSNITTVDVSVEYGFTLCLKFPNRKVDDRICPVDIKRENYICKVAVMSDPNLTSNLKVIPGDDNDIDCDKRESVDEELVVPVKAVCMGCPQTVSLNDPSVLRVADFAVIEYDRTSDESELHTILKLHKAQTQVANGIKYYLTLELAETDCRKPLSAVNMNRSLCNQDLRDESDICEIVALEQPWQQSVELVSARCYDKKDYPTSHRDEFIVPVVGATNNSPPGSFVKTSVAYTPSSQFTPATLHHSTSSDDFKESIDFVVREFNRKEVDDSDDEFYKLLNVIEASSLHDREGQVDHVVIELGETICSRQRAYPDCPFKNGEDIEVCVARVLRNKPLRLLSLDCDDRDDDYRLTTNPVITPYQPLYQPFFLPQPQTLGRPGGPIEQPNDDSTVTDIARFVVSQYNLQSDEDELFKLGKVINSYSKVSGAVVYTLELELLETECKKYQPIDDVSKCPADPREDPEICQAEVTVTMKENGKSTKSLTRIFCDEREDFYIKIMKETSKHTSSGLKEEVFSDKMKAFGRLIADEFDFRSDEDDIFVLVKVLEAKTDDTGLTHHLKVELAETICPKYKQKINKTRCAIDIGEEHKICEAIVTEKPWEKSEDVTELSCFERDDSMEVEDESREVLYPRVHPSAHARPRFLQSRFRVRVDSAESDESNEKYYHPLNAEVRHYDSDEDHDQDDDDHFLTPKLFHNVQHYEVKDDDDDDDDTITDHNRGMLSKYRHFDDDDDDDDVKSNEQRKERDDDDDDDDDKHDDKDHAFDRDDDDDDDLVRNPDNDRDSDHDPDHDDDTDDDDAHTTFDRDNDDDDKDSALRHDNDSSSSELHHLFRFHRSIDGNGGKGGKTSLMFGGFTPVSVNDTKVQALSQFGLNQMDQISTDPRLRRVEEVLEANRKVVSGWLWSFKVKVSYTQCTGDVNSTNLSACEIDLREPSFTCTILVWEKPWEKIKILKDFQCAPSTSGSSSS